MLRSFATDHGIHNVVLAMRDVTQLAKEGERDYYLRLSDASTRCGNVHDAQELVTMYTDVFDRRIKGVVSHYRRTNKNATFIDIMKYAEIQGIAVRARNQALRKVSIDARAPEASASRTLHPRWEARWQSKTHTVAPVESPSQSRHSTIAYDADGHEYEVNLL